MNMTEETENKILKIYFPELESYVITQMTVQKWVEGYRHHFNFLER